MWHCRWSLLILLGVVSCANPVRAAESVRVAGPEHKPRQPQAAVAGDGTVYVAWGAQNGIYVSRARDLESGFSSPLRVGEVDGLMLGARRGPRIAAGGNQSEERKGSFALICPGCSRS